MDLKEEQTIFSDHVVSKRNLDIKARCIQGSVSTLACNNSKCQQYAFVCVNRNCQCRLPHKKCLLTCTDQILQLIQDKRAQSSDVIDKISLVLDKWIDEISKTREKIQDMLLDWGLSGAEKKFIEIIQKEDYKQLTGNHINQITTHTIGYFSEETKERLFKQIERVEQNYQAEINAINKAVLSLFEKYHIQEKDVAFKENIDIDIEDDFHLITELQNFRDKELDNKGKLKRQDYQKTIAFIKDALRKDFEAHMIKFKRNRRAYGSKKLREKYFDGYFTILSKGKEYIKKWQGDTEEHMKYLNKIIESQLKELSVFYHRADGLVEKPFTTEMALSLQNTINVIEMVIDFAKEKGKEKLQFLRNQDKNIEQFFVVAIYFLDEIMDEHPEIDEIEVIWNVVRFSEKLKDEVNLLIDTIKEIGSEVYSYELK